MIPQRCDCDDNPRLSLIPCPVHGELGKEYYELQSTTIGGLLNETAELRAALEDMEKQMSRVAQHNHILIGQLGERRLGLDTLRRYFQSGNGIPVERATIRADAIKELL